MEFLQSSRLEDWCLRAVDNRPRHLAIEVCDSCDKGGEEPYGFICFEEKEVGGLEEGLKLGGTWLALRFI